ncbi:MAG: hypothetical protein QOF19_3365 [Alphaproteobacteria bacterium]|jgi:hypothetical protein|nr:hypothetical protein [Alphaproteobacteria bacterium]
MSSIELDNLVKSGVLKREPADQIEFDGLLDSGKKRLIDATKEGLSDDSQFDLAYNAAHALSLAALRWHGYRPNKLRFIVFQALRHTLGLKPDLWRIFDKSHNNRNSAEYEGYFNVDKQLLTELVRATEIVRKAVEKLGPVPKKRV